MCQLSLEFMLEVPPLSIVVARQHSFCTYHTVQQWSGNTLPPTDWVVLTVLSLHAAVLVLQGWSLEDGQLGPYCFSCLLLLSSIDGDWSEKEEFHSAMNSLDNSLEYVLAPTISYLQRHHSRPLTSLIKCH